MQPADAPRLAEVLAKFSVAVESRSSESLVRSMVSLHGTFIFGPRKCQHTFEHRIIKLTVRQLSQYLSLGDLVLVASATAFHWKEVFD